MHTLGHFYFSLTLIILLVLMTTRGWAQPQSEHLINLKSGQIHFVSNAPLELIEATTSDFRAVMDTVTGKFAFSVPMSSFLGFNSELQRTHFNENYLETSRFPNATYAGKMIEAWETPGRVARNVRTKGQLDIHGAAEERLIPAQISREGDFIRVKATFKVTVANHQIKIPKLVTQKIASEINVTVDVLF